MDMNDKSRFEWTRCHVCKKQYCYIKAFKPATCGKWECVESELGQLLINGKVSEINIGEEVR